MKTTAKAGFAMATVLISSVILLSVLVTSISVTMNVRSTLENQQYTRLAELAGEAGTVYAKACMDSSNGHVTWSNVKPLKPNTDCNGNIVAGLSPYVLEQDNKRSYFAVLEPVADNIAAKGYVEAVRTSTGLAWRIWGSDVAAAASNTDNLPIGTSLDGYWTSAPAGYLLEDGSAISRTTYADLFAVIGTTFGAGNGSTTFNLPDSRGRVAVNTSTDTEFDTLGEKYGAKTHTLTIEEMSSHSHRQSYQSPNGDTLGMATGSNGGGWAIASASGNNSLATPADVPPDGKGNTYRTGSNSPHNNIQPSIVTLRVIKY